MQGRGITHPCAHNSTGATVSAAMTSTLRMMFPSERFSERRRSALFDLHTAVEGGRRAGGGGRRFSGRRDADKQLRLWLALHALLSRKTQRACAARGSWFAPREAPRAFPAPVFRWTSAPRPPPS